jgi:hypothetical protein
LVALGVGTGEVVMRYLVRLHGVALFAALFALIASAASAQAETDSVVVSPGQLEVAQRSELESRLADLETAYQEANVRKPRLVMTGGFAALFAGVIVQSEFFDPNQESQRVGGALIGVGSITIAAGVGGLAFSGVRLKRAKRERRRLEPEIESLRSALDSGTEQR